MLVVSKHFVIDRKFARRSDSNVRKLRRWVGHADDKGSGHTRVNSDDDQTSIWQKDAVFM